MKGKWGQCAAWSAIGMTICALALIFGWWAVCLIALAMAGAAWLLARS